MSPATLDGSTALQTRAMGIKSRRSMQFTEEPRHTLESLYPFQENVGIGIHETAVVVCDSSGIRPLRDVTNYAENVASVTRY